MTIEMILTSYKYMKIQDAINAFIQLKTVIAQ
jgi:hypothetical protein